ACDVAVTGVIGVTKGGKLDHIVVWGTATNCDLVEITIECQTKKRATVQVLNDAWAAFFPAAAETGCDCNATISVYVECTSRECREGQTHFKLVCKEKPNSPLVTAKQPKASDCNNGTRPVTFWYQFVPQAPPVGANLLVDGPSQVAAPA